MKTNKRHFSRRSCKGLVTLTNRGLSFWPKLQSGESAARLATTALACSLIEVVSSSGQNLRCREGEPVGAAEANTLTSSKFLSHFVRSSSRAKDSNLRTGPSPYSVLNPLSIEHAQTVAGGREGGTSTK